MSISRRALLKAGTVLGAGSALTGCSTLAGQGTMPPSTADAAVDHPGAPPMQAPAKSGTAALKDVSLWYWDTGGSGTPIVLLHPFTGSGLVWSYQQPVFARAGYRVIGYSRRGYVNSEPGSADCPGTGSEDLHQLIEYLGIDRFHAVGSAGGAFVAADYALSHPERLRSLVLACSILGAQDPQMSAMLGRLFIPEYGALPEYYRELGPAYRASDPDGTALWRKLQAGSQPGRKVRQSFANHIDLKALGTLKVPTLLICGDADLLAPPPIARLFARTIPRSELVIIPESGHSAYWEQPARFNAAILEFTGRHRR